MRSIEEIDRYIADHMEKQQSAELPLAGIRVLDMATVIAGPFAATLLSDYGAEVIKVENPNNADALRNWGVLEKEGIHPFWSVFGRNKFPITLNLKMVEGRKILMDLVRQSDVLIENIRPGAMEKIGIGKDALLKENPGLVIGSVSGFGSTGPYSKRPGFGTLAEGFSGFTYLNGQPEIIQDPRFKTNEERIKDSNRHILNQIVSQWVGGLDLEELIMICEKTGITIGPISSMEDIAENSHYKERGSLVDIEDPATGINLKIPNVPFRMISTPGSVRFPGLPHGSANRVIFRELLNYSADKIAEMKEAGLI